MALAGLGILLSWIPWIGLALALTALVWCLWIRRRARVAWATGLAIYGILLGALFTGIFVAFPPTRESGAERERRQAFDRLFEAPGGQAGGGGGAAAP